MRTQTCNTQLKQVVRLCTDIHIFSTCQGMPGTTVSGRKRVVRELKMKFQKNQEMKLYMKSCLFLNLASAATSASVLLITLTPYVTSSQGSFYLNHICKWISLKTLAARIFPCLILHTETSNTFEDIIPKASMQGSTDHTCCPPPYAPPLAPLHCPPSQSH